MKSLSVFFFIICFLVFSAWGDIEVEGIGGQDSPLPFTQDTDSAMTNNINFCTETCQEKLKNFSLGKTTSNIAVCEALCWDIIPNILNKSLNTEETIELFVSAIEQREQEQEIKHEICRDMYRRSSIREDCLTYSLGVVQSIEETHDKIRRGNFEEIDEASFIAYIDIGLMPLEDDVERLNRRESKEFLAWLAEFKKNRYSQAFLLLV